MRFLAQRIPDYLRGKYQMIGTVTFTAFFSLVFMLVSLPFSRNAWFQLGPSEAFAFTTAFFIIGLLTVIFSRRVMYATRNLFSLNFLQFILWCLAEALLICLLYTIFTILAHRLGIIELPQERALRIFGNAIVYCITSIAVPYVISGMYFALIDKNNTIRMLNYSNVVTEVDDVPAAPKEDMKVTLFDNSGVLKMAISLSKIWYIESDDNYVVVWYDNSNGEIKNYMVRCRLKTLEESFKGSSLVRCHRKYIVNMDKVKMLRKEKDGYELDLESNSFPAITVTKTYCANVLSHYERN